ncbi:DNA polymerase subunit beta [Natrarchaeobaculum aegyptiacum]|uniref:DNA polymerase subunit beta n=1 Tax=Natrarchaeobaculum aegyptiacum TaxID=745377 RepID=A0A2Z2HQH7_9EURY|nr:DNA polymerase subunit beta [Natrarchaeobaculum aegyptiacum]
MAFGSQVSGDPTRSSDFDVAVKFAKKLSPRERFRKRCFLSGDLQREGEPFVDTSDIEELPLEVAADAVDGSFVCGDEQAFRQFKSEIETEFSERRSDIRRHQRDVIDRIAERGLRG